MKKALVLFFSFMLLLGGGLIGTNFLSAKADTVEKTISTSEEFVSVFSDNSSYDDSSVVIKLTNDIDLEGVELKTISNLGGIFKGEFDGNGYTISNISLKSDGQYFGLIPQASGAKIKDVRVSGKVEYEFKPTYVYELYAGVLVGYGENVKFSNCELDNVVVGENNESTEARINLSIYSNINFGGLVGKLRNDVLGQESPAITNCVNYYDVNVNLVKDRNVFVGGLVGYAENVYMINNLSFGDFVLTNNISGQTNNEIFLGGIAGEVNGSRTNLRNCLYGGEIKNQNSVTNLDLNRGGIIGGIISSQVNVSNINFVYYSDYNLSPSGDGSLPLSEKVAKVVNINRDFLLNSENFDPANVQWDFNKVWRLTNSRFHLQNFQMFDFSFHNILDNGLILKSANLKIGEDASSQVVTTKYDNLVTIELEMKDEFFGYYKLSNILLNGDTLDSKYYEAFEVLDEQNRLKGYNIELRANAMTSGSYSFVMIAKEYKCVITISDEAKEGMFGGFKFTNDTNASLNYEDYDLTFYGNSKERLIIAEGRGIYSFDYWELYFRDSSGKFTVKSDFTEYQNAGLSINFGTQPFDREFKLVAFFTDKAAIRVDFGQYKSNMVSSIKFGGIEYIGAPISVSPNSAPTLEVVLAKDYVMDVDAFTRDIKALYGNNPTSSLVTGEPEKNEDGTTVYKFSINMRYISNFEDNSLKLSFMISEDKSGGGKSLLWLYITLPIVVVIVVAVVIFIVLRKRKYGSLSAGKSGGAKQKKESYKDYY